MNPVGYDVNVVERDTADRAAEPGTGDLETTWRVDSSDRRDRMIYIIPMRFVGSEAKTSKVARYLEVDDVTQAVSEITYKG